MATTVTPHIRHSRKPLPLVSVVIPTYNRIKMLTRLLRSICASDYHKLEIIVVDDCSSDGTSRIVKGLFPSVVVIRNERERLLAASRNEGIRISKGKFVFLIDDDNIVEHSTISELAGYLELNEKAGAVGPLTLHLREPNRIMWVGVKRNMLTSKTTFFGKNEIDIGQYRVPIETMDLPNAFMIRREVVDEVGELNEIDFPIDYDEADFGERVRRAGYKIMVLPSSKVYHGGPSTRPTAFWNSQRAYYQVRNRISFHQKYAKKSHFIAFVVSFLPFFVLYTLLTYKPYPALKGLVDGLSQRKTFRG